jgi:hypothetical protein
LYLNIFFIWLYSLHLLTLNWSQTSTTGGNARSELGQRRPRVEFSFFCRNISYKLGLRTKTKVFDSLQEHPIPNAWVDCPIRASVRGSDFKESLDGQYRITSWYNNIELFFFLFFRSSTSKIKNNNNKLYNR